MYDFSMTAMLRKRIMKRKPVFKQNNFSFCRQENGGYISVRSSNIPRLPGVIFESYFTNYFRRM